MQRFFLSLGVFLWLCMSTISSPLFNWRPGSADILKKPSQRRSTLHRKLLQSDTNRPLPPATHEGTAEKAILTLETRNNRITVYISDKCLLYTVSTEGGAVLAERLTDRDLKDRFPGLYDIVTGTAWAGETRRP
jgi:hypothetical protein